MYARHGVRVDLVSSFYSDLRKMMVTVITLLILMVVFVEQFI